MPPVLWAVNEIPADWFSYREGVNFIEPDSHKQRALHSQLDPIADDQIVQEKSEAEASDASAVGPSKP